MKNKGFTLMETVVVVAIIGIMAMIGTIALYSMNKELNITKLDGYAKEIYLAAQNRLSAMKINGAIADLTPDSITNSNYSEELVNHGYVYLNKEEPGHTDSLKKLLPYGTIDTEVLDNGNYVIEYDSAKGLVLGVFFSEEVSLSDYNTGLGPESVYSNRTKENRKNAGVGFYGTGDYKQEIVLTGVKIEPFIGIENGEQLKVTITCLQPPDNDPTSDLSETEKQEFLNSLLYRVSLLDANGNIVTVLYDTMGAAGEKIIPAHKDWAGVIDDINVTSNTELTIVMDSLIEGGGFFDAGNCDGGGAINVNRGADFKIKVEADCTRAFKRTYASKYSFNSYVDNGTVDKAKYSLKANSLFANNEAYPAEAKIENGRHLQNLQELSAGTAIVGAKLANDVNWETTQIAYGGIDSAYGDMSFSPIQDCPLSEIDGQNYAVQNLPIAVITKGTGSSAKNYSGMLIDYKGTSQAGKLIKNLVLEKPAIGIADETAVESMGFFGNDFQYVDFENCTIKGGSITATAAGQITNLGGFVGVMENGAIKTCSVEPFDDGAGKLMSTVISIKNGENIGGLVGKINTVSILGTDDAVVGDLDKTKHCNIAADISVTDQPASMKLRFGGAVGFVRAKSNIRSDIRDVNVMDSNLLLTTEVNSTNTQNDDDSDTGNRKHFGGVVGYTQDKKIVNISKCSLINSTVECVATADGNPGATPTYVDAGGIAGRIMQDTTVSECLVRGDSSDPNNHVKITGSNYVTNLGGMIGASQTGSKISGDGTEVGSGGSVEYADLLIKSDASGQGLTNNFGGVSGYFAGTGLSDCKVANTTLTVSGDSKIGDGLGGIAANTNTTTMKNNLVQNVDLTITDTVSVTNIGGLIAKGTNANMQIDSCNVDVCSILNTSTAQATDIGGFVGNYAGKGITTSNVTNATVNAHNVKNVGGFAATISNTTGILSDCKVENTEVSSIKTTGEIGGITSVAKAEDYEDYSAGKSAGGFAGYLSGNVQRCYANGTTVDSYAIEGTGGFAGILKNAKVENCGVKWIDNNTAEKPEISGYYKTSGFAGYAESTEIYQSFAAVEQLNNLWVSSSYTNTPYIGGFIGQGKRVTVFECYASAVNIKLQKTERGNAAGFVGNLETDRSNFDYCFASIKDFEYTNNSSYSTSNRVNYALGGFCGYINNQTNHRLNNCYAVSDMTKSSNVRRHGFGRGKHDAGNSINLSYTTDNGTKQYINQNSGILNDQIGERKNPNQLNSLYSGLPGGFFSQSQVATDTNKYTTQSSPYYPYCMLNNVKPFYGAWPEGSSF